MNVHTPPPAAYAADIRAALERVTGSATFRSSPQLVAFLRLVVEMTLDGAADRIKAYTIGTDALGRDQSFDPQRDPIVRVEANRLRRALASYYAGPGAQDAIIIEIPSGRYVPTFRLRVGDDVPAESASGRPDSGWPLRLLARGAAGLVVVLIMALAVAEALLTSSPSPQHEQGGIQANALAGAPLLVIEPVKAVPASAGSLAAGVTGELVKVATGFPTITVVSGLDASAVQDRAGAGTRAKPVYRLTGFVESRSNGTANVTLQLVNNGVIAWSRDWLIAGDGTPTPETIARETATDLVTAFGVIHARLRAQPGEVAPGFRCLMAAVDYMRKFDLGQHESIRNCLEQTVAEDPRVSTAYALLAFVYEREYFVDLPARPGEAPPLERARQAAERALALSPGSAVVQLAVMDEHYLNGDLTGAFAAGERAISLNPLDPAAAGVVGVRMVLGGEIERGAALLDRAASHYSVNPSWLDFGLFCVAYLKGDMTAAARYASSQVSDTYPFGLVARALVAAAAGDRNRARSTLVRLAGLYPSWSDPRRMLARFIRAPKIVDRLARDIDAINEE